MNNKKLSESVSTDGLIRLLIDAVRDQLAKQSNKDYKSISNTIKFLIGEEIEPEELERFDEIFRRRKLLDRQFFRKLDANEEELRFIQANKKERLLEDFVETYIKKGKIKRS